MCLLQVENYIQPLVTDSTVRVACDKTTILKISLFVIGLLLIGGSLATHFYQVNAIAVYTTGVIGGVLILAITIASIVQYISRKHAEADKFKESFQSHMEGSSVSVKNDNKRESSAQDHKEYSEKAIAKGPHAPKNFISQLPKWLTDYAADLPYLQLPGNALQFSSFKEIKRPILLCSAGSTIGIYMRLRVNHVSVDPSYVHIKDLKNHKKNETNESSKNPFIIEAIAYPRWLDDDFWLLISNNRYPCIEHRNAPYDTERVLGSNVFNCHASDPLKPEIIQQFINTAKQDDLPAEDRHYLGWLLLRLLKVGHLEVREKKTNVAYHSFDDPAVGYWQISIDQ